MNQKCEAVIVQLVIVTRDADGDAMQEQTTQAVKILRNKATADFWAGVDQIVAALSKGKE